MGVHLGYTHGKVSGFPTGISRRFPSWPASFLLCSLRRPWKSPQDPRNRKPVHLPHHVLARSHHKVLPANAPARTNVVNVSERRFTLRCFPHVPAMSPFLPHGHQRLFMGWPWETEGKVHEAGTCQGSLGTPGGNTKGEVPERWGQSSQRTLTSPSNVHPGHSPRGPQGPHL